MIRKTLIYLALAFMISLNSFGQSNFGTLTGKVFDAKSGEPLIGANIVVLLDGIQKGGASTDINGNYTIKPIPPGTYNIRATYIGYNDQIIQNVFIGSGKITYQDIKLKEKVIETNVVEIIEYTKPLVEKTEGTGTTLSAEDIKKAPTRSIGDLVQLTPGIQGGSVKGQRSEGTVYLVDGIKVRGSTGIPNSMIAEINTVTGGISAEYGDLTGGVISITTRGPSNKFAGSIEAITSELLDPYGYNTIEGGISGPIIVRNNSKKGTPSQEAILGYLIGGNINYRKDPSPSPIPFWKVKEEVYEQIYNNPLAPSPGGLGFVPAAEYITKDGMEQIKVHPDIENQSYTLSSKIDFQPKPTFNITLGTMGSYSKGKGYSWTYSLFNWKEASKAQFINTTFRSYIRFYQKLNFGEEQSKDKGKTTEVKKGLKISNAYYTIMADYTKNYNISQHRDFKDNFFQYGFLGTYERYYEPVYRYDYDTIDGKLEQAFLFSGFRDTFVKFTPYAYNEARANYTKQLYQLRNNVVPDLNTIQRLGGLLNGDNPGNVYSLWTNIGAIAIGYSKYNEDQFRITGKASMDINHHAVAFGFEYEQRLQNSYSVGPNSLWTVMRSLINSHLQQLDTRNPIPVYDSFGNFLDTINYPILNDGKQTTFDKNFREYLKSIGARDVYGNPITDQSLINIDRYTPDYFSLNMFSADELLSRNLVSYYGYDYLGKRLKQKPSIDDFLNSDQRLIAPLNPIYMAGFIEDLFFFRDMIFRVGIRVDRFDANQLVLKDKYTLYPVYTVAEVKTLNGKNVTHPGNMGPDYVVYVDDAFKPTKIVGYRSGDRWFNSSGAEITDPNVLALETTSGNIAPYLVERNEDNLKITKESFKDYEPQVDVSPRIYFSFPISDVANFFANYDIRVMRPTTGLFTTIDDYYYLEQRGTSSLNNAALKPQRITSYEIGFKQAISKNSAITINSYYNETRNLINVRMINQAYPRSYMTFDNIDFSTVKGFSFQYDLRRTKTNNVQLLVSYTLQFADGTGSNSASQANLISTGQPNLRTPFPLDNDYRHTITGQLDYRFRGGELYNGPLTKKGKRLLENTGVNFLFSATSGRPYTKQGNVTEAVGIGIRQSEVLKGTLNGSRYPWTYGVNVKLDRDFLIYKKKESDKKLTSMPIMMINAYIWVQNLFNIKNIVYVYRFTGDPDDDGFLSSSLGVTAVKEATLSQAFFDQYMIKVNYPFNYGSPRLVRLGATISF